MMDAIRQITIPEVALVFILLFVLPLLLLLTLRLRRFEAQFGEPSGGEKKTGKPDAPVSAPAAAAPAEDAVPDNVYPYKVKTFLSPSDRACLEAMREALGDEVDVFPKVALWELVETTDKAPGYLKRLHDKDYDFLVCDRRTGQPLTAVMYNPGKGRPAGRIDEIKKICRAAGANVVFIDQAAEYDADSLKKALGLPELDL
jgi:hypothetical protein